MPTWELDRFRDTTFIFIQYDVPYESRITFFQHPEYLHSLCISESSRDSRVTKNKSRGQGRNVRARTRSPFFDRKIEDSFHKRYCTTKKKEKEEKRYSETENFRVCCCGARKIRNIRCISGSETAGVSILITSKRAPASGCVWRASRSDARRRFAWNWKPLGGAPRSPLVTMEIADWNFQRPTASPRAWISRDRLIHSPPESMGREPFFFRSATHRRRNIGDSANPPRFQSLSSLRVIPDFSLFSIFVSSPCIQIFIYIPMILFIFKQITNSFSLVYFLH